MRNFECTRLASSWGHLSSASTSGGGIGSVRPGLITRNTLHPTAEPHPLHVHALCNGKKYSLVLLFAALSLKELGCKDQKLKRQRCQGKKLARYISSVHVTVGQVCSSVGQ